jgi:hypothetical protein
VPNPPRLVELLSAEGDEDTDRVALRRLHQHFAVVADSDKREPADVLKDRVDRVGSELADNPTGYMLVTSGREIESYVPHDDLEKAVVSVHPTVARLRGRRSAESDPLWATKADGKKLVSIDKVGIAEAVTRLGVTLDELDLQQRIDDLVELIRAANH